MTRIFKFGGASIQDADAIRHLAHLLDAHDSRPLMVVVSAMGKTTNGLEALLAAARSGADDDYRQRLAALEANHLAVAEALLGDAARPVTQRITALFEELDERHQRYRQAAYSLHYDQTVCYGELLSTRLVAAWLNHCGIATEWCDARELIVTDDRHQAANIDWEATAERVRSLALDDGRLWITQGFIGGTRDGLSTTLGREGSDFSAAILAHCLDAEDLTIWKDVPGVFNADPRRFDNAVQLHRLSYAEAVEQTWYGAKVIHPRTLAPLQRKGIPLTVRSFLDLDAPPSRIGPEPGEGDRLPSFILRDDQLLIDIAPSDFSFIDEARLADVLARLAAAGLHANLLDLEAMRLRLVVDHKPEPLAPLLADLERDYRVTTRRDLALLTVRHHSDALLAALSEGRTVIAERRNATNAQRLFHAEECPETWHIPG
ncbi:aspartate kinase [Halomonas campisalis]|uniref:Aspartokinase n=1 Tax=Billgrantia campisalis TaxID=74661 RepID=A0ABS9PCK8_9GAMM|nr:aspartate kinase [Halomonas campisalis]MCG6659507.1 aspartate kinase [Halomonas campisalis]MDR5864454.1 aspartate kinase [Halomonas campisalis]